MSACPCVAEIMREIPFAPLTELIREYADECSKLCIEDVISHTPRPVGSRIQYKYPKQAFDSVEPSGWLIYSDLGQNRICINCDPNDVIAQLELLSKLSINDVDALGYIMDLSLALTRNGSRHGQFSCQRCVAVASPRCNIVASPR